MDDKRVYGKKINIDTSKTAEFYNKRAKTIGSRKEAYTAVLLGDQNPEYAKKWDEFEKAFILPKMLLDKSKNVIDLGCGMGRWAKTVAPLVNRYCGVDFSSDMIAFAKANITYDNCTFINESFLEAFGDEKLLKYKYDVVIIAGVSMYINDDVIKSCYQKLHSILNPGALIYIEESIGVKERLTLNHIWSENLGDYYEAIYRTAEEYKELLEELSDCYMVEEGLMDNLDKKEQSETSHWYSILQYRGH